MNRLSFLRSGLVGVAVAVTISVFINRLNAAAVKPPDLTHLAAMAVSDDPTIAHDAVVQLRAAGPAGLAALMATHADAIRQHVGAVTGVEDTTAWRRVSSAIDAVAAQRDAYTSGLYWYTDLDAAKSVAKAAGKPILSLRLLGKLDEEYSCANSRFFRTALYANTDVSRFLREHFILHWQSVRPVPKITIDFGDGRKVQRTITGNSIHYVLDTDGRVIDAIPGLYGPTAFLRQLDAVEQEARQLAANSADIDIQLRQWHTFQSAQIMQAWRYDLHQLGAIASIAPVNIVTGSVILASDNPPKNPPPALAAAPLAIGKGRVEMNLVRAVSPDAPASVLSMEAGIDDATWAKIAALHQDDAKLDDASRGLIAAKNPVVAAKAARAAVSKRYVEDPLILLVTNFERSIAQDTVRNEYVFHRKIHEWLADSMQAALASDVNALNERVYAELFLTPSSDPWLGLLPANTYSALEEDGVCK